MAAMNTWSSKTSAAWVAAELGLSESVASSVAAEFAAMDIEGDGLLGNMRHVEKVLAQHLVDRDAAEAVAALCTARDGMPLSPPASFAASPRPPAEEDWANILADAGPQEAQVQAALQGAVDRWRGGRWALSTRLGQGGSGVVLAAEDARLGRIAIKFTHAEDRGKAEREAALMQRVAHEHVCRLFEHAMVADSLHAMVIELLSMGSLEELRKRSADGRIREFEVVRMASHILSALSFIHGKDVIHRDIKPSNIMLTAGEEEGRVVFKLIDFSVSAIELTAQSQVSDTLATNTAGLQAQVGTPHYMSPEQITASVVVTPQTDLWSLGVVVFECLSGIKPFAPDTSDQLSIAYAVVNTEAPMLPDIIAEVGIVSDKMAAFVSHSLRKDMTDRFQTAAAMTAALEAALSASADEQFALFISYRVWCDKEFAQALFKATSATQLREGREHRMNVYLDKVRLLDGQRFDVGFIKGLASSTVFAPLMSQDCMQSFPKLEQTDKADFVLMEWIVAIELQKRGIVKAIFPIVMGQQADDGKYEQFFFEKLLQGEVNGRPLPDVVSKKTIEKAREFLGMLAEPVELSQELTVKQVVETILTFQAILLHFENDAIDKQTGLVRQGSVTLTRTHSGDKQTTAQAHVISVCAERIAKVVKSFQPAQQPEPEPEPEPESGSIYNAAGGFTVALGVPDYDTPEGMVAQIKEAEDHRIRKLRRYKRGCGALVLCVICALVGVFFFNRTEPAAANKPDIPAIVDLCDGVDCGHGECSSTLTTHTCICASASGWSGDACDHPTGCDSSPCKHGGTCTANGGTHSCGCAGTGYTGESCSTPVSCGPAPSPPHSTGCSGSNKIFGESCTATCDSRFYTGGSGTFTCDADGRYSSSLTCEPRVLTPVGAGPFPGSQIITLEWGEVLIGWTNSSVPEGEWTLCYSSFTDDATTPAVFHSQCDPYNATVSVARNAGDGGDRNPGNYTFGGFGGGSWNMTACCEDPRNDCSHSGICYDQTASEDFLFGLWMPGREGGAGPQRYLPTGASTNYQRVDPEHWPAWGANFDLSMGSVSNGPLGGDYGYCNQGGTYAGSPNEICGGGSNWGATQLEVWRPACTTCGGHGACDASTRVCACDAGFKLENTATCVVDPCYEKDCSGHGSCEPFAGVCVCDFNYRGADCSEGRGPSPLFLGTQLIAAEWGEELTGLTEVSVPEAEWTLCFSSLKDDATTPAVFHSQCDDYNATLSVAHNAGGEHNGKTNPGNYTFGGFGAGSWDKEACCEDPRNDCSYSHACIDHSSSQDFLFGLWMPGRDGGAGPQRYLPTGAYTDYQYVRPEQWPAWGSNSDLSMGSTNGPGGSNGFCDQGGTYAGSLHEICGGDKNWGATQLEVWRPACTTCGGHGACDNSTRVCACDAGYALANPATCVRA